MSINDGGPAFGQVVELRCVRVEMNGDTEWEPEAMTLGGLTVRDYFAAKAMQTILSRVVEVDGSMTTHAIEAATDGAYFVADAMIRAREQK